MIKCTALFLSIVIGIASAGVVPRQATLTSQYESSSSSSFNGVHSSIVDGNSYPTGATGVGTLTPTVAYSSDLINPIASAALNTLSSTATVGISGNQEDPQQARPVKFYDFTVTWGDVDANGETRPAILINGQTPGPLIELEEGQQVSVSRGSVHGSYAGQDLIRKTHVPTLGQTEQQAGPTNHDARSRDHSGRYHLGRRSSGSHVSLVAKVGSLHAELRSPVCSTAGNIPSKTGLALPTIGRLGSTGSTGQ